MDVCSVMNVTGLGKVHRGNAARNYGDSVYCKRKSLHCWTSIKMWLILLSATCCISTKCPYGGVKQKVCLKCLVTGDESWIHCFEPEMKRVGKEWCHFSSSCQRGPQSPVPHFVTSLGTICDQLSDQNIMVCSVVVSCCSSMAMICHLQLVW